jgi:hypothetical protein
VIDVGRLEAPRVRPTVRDLRSVRDMLVAAGDTSAANVAEALGAILNGLDPVIALGLKATAGRRSALTLDRLSRRDELIRHLAQSFFPDMPISDQARRISEAAAAYWRRAAKLDRELLEMPGSYVDTARELLFHIARLPADMPKERSIRAILAASPPRGRPLNTLALSEGYSLPAGGARSLSTDYIYEREGAPDGQTTTR